MFEVEHIFSKAMAINAFLHFRVHRLIGKSLKMHEG